jgi:protein involved in polysaccharide export with SLBB domain
MNILNIQKTYLFIIFLFSSFTVAQEIDESFLKSLPSDMQQDILKRADKSGGAEEPVYRSIESQTKLEKKNLEDLKKRLEDDLKLLEQELYEDKGNIENRDSLILFGSDFFSTYQSTYMPINEPNLSPSYILDSGDVLEVQLVGQKSFTQQLKIKRDGSINLEDIGKIKLAGLSLDDASSLIKNKVNSSFIGTSAFISLSNIRDINVLVSGNAFNPGIYTVSGNSSMLHAIAVAGGISEYGSYREINLIRNQQVIETLDMYDVLITGRFNSSTSLKTGDIIFVSPVKNIATIDGAVKVPAKYELFDNQNLSSLIDYSNGISKDADIDNIYLDRILDGKVKSLPIQSIKQFSDIAVMDGDKVFIRKHAFRNVIIEGAVLKPGSYVIAEGESVSDLIEKSGGYTKNAYPFGAVYENEKALAINKMAKELLYEEFIDNIITVSQKNPVEGFDLSGVVELTQKLNTAKPNGRVVIDLGNPLNADSLVIRNGDKLTIPEKPNHVYIYGEVSYEGALIFEPSKSIDFYISKSGGLKDNANNKAIYVLHPNGDTQRSFIRKSLFQNSPDKELKLYPGSIIFIPRGIDDSATTRLAAQAYVSILGNIGIALASLSSINNN